MDEIRSAVRAVLAGDIAAPIGMDLGVERDPEISDLIRRLQTLTPQQTRVLGMLAEGLLNKQIAYELGVSEATSRRMSRPSCKSSASTAAPRRSSSSPRIGGDPLPAAG